MTKVTAYIWVAHSGEGKAYIAVPESHASWGMKHSIMWKRWGNGTIPGNSEKLPVPVLVAEAKQVLPFYGRFAVTFGPIGFRADDGEVVETEIELEKLKD